MVWYQKFEYAVGHWLQKTAEHVFGSVLCSPGCFSLFRGSALMDDNVLKRYTTTATRASEYVQYDQGRGKYRRATTNIYLFQFCICTFLQQSFDPFPQCLSMYAFISRRGSLALYTFTAARLACGIQCCIRCIHQLTTRVQRVL